MTTETPTSNNAAQTAAQIAANILSEAALEQLANEFFHALPNDAGSASHAIAHSTLSLAPTGTTMTGAPDTLAQSAPAHEGRVGGVTQNVPQGYLPTLDSVPVSASVSPYYFLEETNSYTPKDASRQDDRVTAQPFGLPGAGALNSVLGEISLGYPLTSDPTPAAPRTSDSHFYFLEPAGAETKYDASSPQGSRGGFDVDGVRRDFPALHQKVHGKPLIWLDSAATSQKPQTVIDAESYFYEHDNSNIHRAAHALAARATDAYEGARQKIQHFLGAASPDEIVFVRGATEGINLLAQTCGRQRIQPGDEIVLTTLEHHANIVPWQFLAQEKGATLRVVPVNNRGEILLDEYEKLLGPRTRIVALTHVSNTLGTVVPVELMTAMAHAYGAAVVIDGAQSVPHFRINVQAMDCDFFVFSGHKLFAPTGIGVLYGKKALLDAMPPWQGGGNMIDQVTFERTTFNKVPYKFEAGTGNIAGAVGLGAAIDYLNRIGFEAAAHYEDGLLAYGTEKLSAIPGLRLIGNAAHKVGTLSFVLDGTKPEDVGKFLDREGIAVRAGHHCAQPTMQRFNVVGMVRPSLAFYNTYQEVDALAAAVAKARKALS